MGMVDESFREEEGIKRTKKEVATFLDYKESKSKAFIAPK